MATEQYDVAIIGGGPAGSTAGTLLRKYKPNIRVLILEREKFPRDHVGESQLPGISRILDEMGCWDKVEAANFPIKIGATYKWGKTAELWDFDFMPPQMIQELPRPGKYEGQRVHLAFQVDRSIYDHILLDHALEHGCEVRQETRVTSVQAEGDRVTGLRLENGEEVSARWYFDASGHSGILRRALDVEATYPTALQNIAIWDYWQNATWAEEIGIGGTRVQVMSLGYGWIWFIPLGPTRTSVGLVIPKTTFKEMGLSPQEAYTQALTQESRIRGFMEGAVSEHKLQTTRDWSFEAARHCGENWFLIGESSGFADPILSAGLSITHACAREAAFTILTMDANPADKEWLASEYNTRQSRRIQAHIRFADYWYTANTQFSELKAFTSTIAKESGLNLDPEEAWRWLGQGGFILDDQTFGLAGIHFTLFADLSNHLAQLPNIHEVENNNVFVMDVKGAAHQDFAQYEDGHVIKIPCLTRNGKIWPLQGAYGIWHKILRIAKTTPEIIDGLKATLPRNLTPHEHNTQMFHIGTALNVLIVEGWVKASMDPRYPIFKPMSYTKTIHKHERDAPLQTVGKGRKG
ncbi:MAG TPA: NAD(P)/FAD-dependent oxidoreductase [Fimbriimonas sp.]|nr:NAD(P)/FAD-dependent oxidoreductase [Fimbriimonas sp.]